MPSSRRKYFLRIGVIVCVFIALIAGIAILRNAPSEAGLVMPSDQREYWEWVGSINRTPETAVDSGIELLRENPYLTALYLRLAQACIENGEVNTCQTALDQVDSADAKTTLYRDAAYTLLLAEEQEDVSIENWKTIAASPALDPTLARLIVDTAQRNPENEWLPEIEAAWQASLSTDSTQIGAAFGLGYAAVRRSDWDTSEPLLNHVKRLQPDDSQAYRELGRIYYSTGQPDRFDEITTAGIEAAHRSFDLEQELILQGNLGLAVLNWMGDLERAAGLFEEALSQSLVLSQERTAGFNMYRLANIRARQNRYQEALALLDSADIRYQTYVPAQRSEVLSLRGSTLRAMFRFSDAATVLEEAMAEAEAYNDPRGQVETLIALSQLYLQMGNYVEAREAGLSARELADKYRATDFGIAARIVLGDVERSGADLERAESHYQEGLALAEQTENHARMRELYERLGNKALDLQDFSTAQGFFNQMLESVRYMEDSRNLAVAYSGLGRTYLQYKNYSESIRLLDLALDQLEGEREISIRSDILSFKAWALYEMGNLDQAESLLLEALSLVPYNTDRQYRIEVALGYVFLKKGLFEDALEHFDDAESVENQLQFSSMHSDVSFGRAIAQWRLGHLSEAEQAFNDAISIIETKRDNIQSAEGRSFFIQQKEKLEVYEVFSVFLEEQGRTDEALHFNERARSRILVDLLYTSQQAGVVNLSDQTSQAIEMHRRLLAIDQAIDNESIPLESEETSMYRTSRAAFLRQERLRADSSYRQVEINLYGNNPIYTFLPLQADSIQTILTEQEAIVVYNLRTITTGTELQESTVAYVVLPDTILICPLEINALELLETVRFFRDQIGDVNGGPESGWETTARRLYDALIAPVRAVLPATIQHLNIVPEGVMHYLPFAALQDDGGSFLVEAYTLSIAPSATILKLCRERNPRRWSYILLIADPDGRLPGARQEALSIASGAPSRRIILIGAEATQGTFEEVAEDYDIIHFATHGYFNHRAPWDSHLELHDDILRLEEIGRLKLDAYLVTLSACETALSGGLIYDVPNGDEWVGLNQSFLAAGTPTVMASLWPIDDSVSSTFMSGFYDYLGTEGKSFALAEMQRRFIRNPSTRHPFYWAAFTIIGDPL